MEVVEVLITLSSKTILISTFESLSTLLEECYSQTQVPQCPETFKAGLNVSSKDGFHSLSLHSCPDYKEEMTLLYPLAHSSYNINLVHSLNYVQFVDNVINFSNYVDGEKVKTVDNSAFGSRPLLRVFNHLVKQIEKNVSISAKCLVCNVVINVDSINFIKALYDYANMTSLILGLYRRFNYFLLKDTVWCETGREEITGILFHTIECVNYIGRTTNVDFSPSLLSNIFLSIVKK